MQESTKKALCIAMIPIICFLLGMTEISADLNRQKTLKEMTGYLYDNEGHRIEITGYSIHPTDDLTISDEEDVAEVTITYLYTIDGSAFVQTESGSRPGSFLKLFLVNHYYQDGSLNVLTAVSGNWEVRDPHTTVTSASVAYASRGASSPGQYGETPVENDFLIETGFDKLMLAEAGSAGSELTLELLVDGSETWTFVAGNQLEHKSNLGRPS